MSLYYMPPPPPRPAWPSLWVDRTRARFKALSRENRWVLVGLLLAQAMVFAIYLLLVDNLAHNETKRVARELHVQEHHRCAMLDGRLERRQCFVSLQMREAPPTLTVMLAQQ